jgi:hypothetical protein
MFIFSVLICIVSFTSQLLVSLNVHNKCQYISLTSPVYFIYGGRWDVIPDQEIYTNAVMRNYLKLDSGQGILGGILTYKIQRKHTESDKLIQNESKCIQLLIAWCDGHTEGLHVRALLVEHDGELDEDKLMRLYQKYWYSLDVWVNPIGSNWLLDDTTILTTTVEKMSGGYRWDILISEGMRDNIVRPLWFDVER